MSVEVNLFHHVPARGVHYILSHCFFAFKARDVAFFIIPTFPVSPLKTPGL
jgi:hypothetical protein